MSESSPTDRSRTSVGRFTRWLGGTSTIQATGRFLRQQLWAWPILAAAVFGVVGWWVHESVDGAMREDRVADLNVTLEASVVAMRIWTAEQRIALSLLTDDDRLLPLVKELVPLAGGTDRAERLLRDAKAQEGLHARLRSRIRPGGYVGYVVVAPDGMVLASDQISAIGQRLNGYRKEVLGRAIKGEVVVSRPFRSILPLPDEKGELRANLPTMYVMGPLPDERGKPVAALGLRIRPEDQFTRILESVRFGETGETFAFDATGLLLSQSRFDDVMKQIGLLADQPEVRSILTVEVRDPGVNMMEGGRPTVRRPEQPLTRMAAEAVAGRDGHDADGYRDYRGVRCVGAWRWLPEEGFGVATEIDVSEAFRPVYILRRAFWGLMALLLLSAVGIFLAMLLIARQQRALQRATLAARQLGQYALEEKLGAGGMGTVYRARHAMLRRPTAVKLLDADNLSDAAVARFEREVQLTGSLTHPNTVAVYDYGRTPEGVFYYAMEYLEGMTLEDLVKRHGPVPEARAVFVLRQVCGALAEAHAAGLVHRDVKPANVFMTKRGGMHDFVKVLDFGLVKSLGPEPANLTSPNAVMGTPYYMAPEAVNRPAAVDARADVYAVGAVGYFLLTATTVFEGASVLDICLKHTREQPEPPSARGGRSLSAGLERLLLRCLAKDPADRPADAAALLAELEGCAVEGVWTVREAAAWWASLSVTAAGMTVAFPMDTGRDEGRS